MGKAVSYTTFNFVFAVYCVHGRVSCLKSCHLTCNKDYANILSFKCNFSSIYSSELVISFIYIVMGLEKIIFQSATVVIILENSSCLPNSSSKHLSTHKFWGMKLNTQKFMSRFYMPSLVKSWFITSVNDLLAPTPPRFI